MSVRVPHRLPTRPPGAAAGVALKKAAKRWGLALVRYRLSSFNDDPEYEAEGAVLPENMNKARRIGRQMGLELAPERRIHEDGS